VQSRLALTCTDYVWTMKSGLEKSYEVSLVDDLRNDTWKQLQEDRLNGRKGLLITTPSVARLQASRISSILARSGSLVLVEMQLSEQTKSLDAVRCLCEKAIIEGLDRESVLVSLGGGVCCDVVTMAASLIRRGIGHIRIPTTLLGQVDAGVGIKGAVNLYQKKSAVGCYHPPEWVLIDPSFLETLPECHLRNGFAEIAKIAIVSDSALFRLVEEHGSTIVLHGFQCRDTHHRHIVWNAAVRMLEQLEPNLYENRTFKRLPDFGHTFSPCLEAASGFGLRHGETVAIDIALCAVLAWRLGMLTRDMRDRILHLLLTLGLPIYSPLLTAQLCEHALDEAKRHRGGQVNLVVPTGLSTATFIETSDGLTGPIGSAVRWLRGYTQRPGPGVEGASRLAMGAEYSA
jgi:2-epi-5-epi-valiolone synthase